MLKELCVSVIVVDRKHIYMYNKQKPLLILHWPLNNQNSKMFGKLTLDTCMYVYVPPMHSHAAPVHAGRTQTF